MQGVTCWEWSTSSRLYIKYHNPSESFPPHSLQPQSQGSPPVLDGDTYSRRSICAGGCMACTFSSVSQAVKKSKQKSAPTDRSSIPILLCPWLFPAQEFRPILGTISLLMLLEGASRPSLNSSTWHMKPRLRSAKRATPRHAAQWPMPT